MTNCIVLAHPGGRIFWGSGPSIFSYYNCKFGEIGQAYEDLVDTLPESYVDRDISLGAVEVTKLTVDPFTRGVTDFFTPGVLNIPEGFLKPSKSKERTFIEKLIDLVNSWKGLQ
jgi:hypothetical protein